jgi:uncharacterized repeat protein (TIGR03803 family)
MPNHARSLTLSITLALVTALMLFAATRLDAQANVIYSFGAYATDGETPWTSYLVADSAGNLYGTTDETVSGTTGTVFELSPGSSGWTEQIIHYFDGSDGDMTGVSSGLTIDSSGNLYGIASTGGSDGDGVVFELSPSGGGWNFSVIHNFNGGPDGENPTGSLILNATGDLYGVTANGGTSGYGTVFEMHNSSGTWVKRTIFNFANTNGYNPNGPLVMDASGNLYGTTYNGGLNSKGIVFELRRNAAWAEKILHNFGATPSDGVNPDGGLVLLSGNLYGTTISGGVNGAGTVFEVTQTSGGWAEGVIHSFNTTGTDGDQPRAGLTVVGSDLYGTTISGGANNFDGTVFGLTFVSGVWTENYLVSMSDASGGAAFPSGGLLLYSDGNLYGTAQGGANGVGSVYYVTP